MFLLIESILKATTMIHFYDKLKTLFQKNNFAKDLWHFDGHALNAFSIILLISLNLFLLFAVFDGIESEQQKSPTPSSYFPHECKVHFDTNHQNPANTTYKDFDSSPMYDNGYPYVEPLRETTTISPLCEQLKEKVSVVTSQKDFQTNLMLHKELLALIQQTQVRISELRETYNIRLTEMIAKQTNDTEFIKAKKEFDSLTITQNTTQKRVDALPKIETYKGFKELRDFVQANQTNFIEQEKSYSKWYPFYNYFRMLSFVLPLLLLVYLVYRKTPDTKATPIINLICANLVVILTLPLLFGTIELIYELIPKILLEKIVDFFISIGLLSILKYILIGIITLIVGSLIYFVQKKSAQMALKRDASQIQRIVANGLCGRCKNKVNENYHFCPVCGNDLMTTCSHCSKEIKKELPYCNHCGKLNHDLMKDTDNYNV
jgi:hypothetical protein